MKFENPEQAFAERRWPELSETEERLYGILVPENKKRAIKPEDFSDLYGKETIEKDLAVVKKIEEGFGAKNADDPEARLWIERGWLFEAIVNDQIDRSAWFGEGAEVIVPSRYDDLINGVDSIVEFEETQDANPSHLALAVDITKSGVQLQRKFGDIKRSIEDGKLSEIKYFASERVRGELRQVPRVVVGADQRTMEEVADLLLRFKIRQQHPALRKESGLSEQEIAAAQNEFRTVRDALKDHPLQFQLLSEMQRELEGFRNYASSIGKHKVARIYERALQTVNRILEGRIRGKNFSAIDQTMRSDGVYDMIMEQAEKFG